MEGRVIRTLFGEVSRKEALAMAGIAILAAALRLIHLNSSLWYDEIITLIQSIRLPAGELLTTYGSLNNHVLYSWLAKFSAMLFGETPAALRAPAVIFGVASIIAAWRLFRGEDRNWPAVGVALLLALSFHHVWFSQNARGYTGLLLFTTIATIYLVRAVRKDRTSDWFAYGVATGVAMLIHLSAAFFIVAQGLIVSIIALRNILGGRSLFEAIRGPAIGFGVAGGLTLIVFAPMICGMITTIQGVSSAGAALERQVVEWKNPLWTLTETISSFGIVGAAAPLAIFFMIVGSYRLLRSSPVVAASYLLHIPITVIILTALSMRVWPRYFFIDIAFLFAAIVIGAFWFADFVWRRLKFDSRMGRGSGLLKAAGFFLMAAASIPLLLWNYRLPKQDFDGALAFIEASSAPGDNFAAPGLAGVYFNEFRRLGWASPEVGQDFETFLRRPGRLWVVTSFPQQFRAYYPEMQSELDQKFELAGRFAGTLSGGDIHVYRSLEP